MKQVKIIGLTVKSGLGILKACELEFNPENRLVPVLGAVGAGKTTLQKSLQLGTMGSKTLPNDKNLYGDIDQEIRLLDGDKKVYVSCKTDTTGSISYTIYMKDDDGKIVKNPVLDGVSATPAKYLESLQTALTWRMEELTSDNTTVQRDILLSIYKDEIEKEGVIFDKSNPLYDGSILGLIEKSKILRADRDFKRKQVGGFRKHLEEQGYNVDDQESFPKRQDVEEMQKKISVLEYELTNAEKTFNENKNQELKTIELASQQTTYSLRQLNDRIKEKNSLVLENRNALTGCIHDFKVASEKLIAASDTKISEDINAIIEKVTPKNTPEIMKEIRFSEDGKCLENDWNEPGDIRNLILELNKLRKKYVSESSKRFDANFSDEKNIENLKRDLIQAKHINSICDAVDSFRQWQESDLLVKDLLSKYHKKLLNINTGVEGLSIHVDEESEKMDLRLMYNGSYDPIYFGNPDMEPRKISSYSGTQKPIICLLVQNYLLSKKEKSGRYIWIDNIPIDKKTRELLETMGNTLNLTIFVNITGDFSKSELKDGEILIEGGEVFFK